MSRTNKHRTNRPKGIAFLYMQTVLGPRPKCPRRSCPGTMVEVLARYEERGPVNHEKECVICGKVIKDPFFKKEREQRWRERKKNWSDRQKKGKTI